MEYQLQKGTVAFVTEPTPRWIFTSPNRAEGKDLILFGDAVANLVKYLPEALTFAQALQINDEEPANQNDVFEKTLSVFSGKGENGQILKFKNCLSVNVFNGFVNLWIKRVFFAEDTQTYIACRGSFQICLTDETDALVEFLNRHLVAVQEAKKLKI